MDELEEVRLVRLSPGDVLAFVTERTLTMAEVDQIRRRMREIWPHNECTVAAGGDLAVIRKDEA